MALRNYEIMFLLDSGKYATDPDAVNAEVNEILEKVGAEVIAARPWMDGKLAYEIEGHRKGVHYLVYAKAESENVQKLPRLCKLSAVVLRHLCILPPEKLFDLMASALIEPESSEASTEPGAEAEASKEPSKEASKEESKEGEAKEEPKEEAKEGEATSKSSGEEEAVAAS